MNKTSARKQHPPPNGTAIPARPRQTAQPERPGQAATADPDQVQSFDLSWHLPHLLRRAHFDAEACFGEIYGNAATSRQLALLVALAQQPGATQVEIARVIGLDANTCSDLVRRTCAKGLLERRRGKQDARAYALELTKAGRALLLGSALPLAEPYSARIAARLTPTQRHKLAHLLRLMLGFHVPASRARAKGGAVN